jgi:hypothetical protein
MADSRARHRLDEASILFFLEAMTGPYNKGQENA